MEDRQSAGMLIAKLVVFAILAILALRIALWVLRVVSSLLVGVIQIAVIVLVIYGIYYLLFGRKSRY